MNATPATAARQIATARKINRVEPNRLAYTSETGVDRTYPDLGAGTGLLSGVPAVDEHEPHCFVCGRHTDHFGEHDDAVEAGTAYYDEDGDVWPMGQGPRFYR